MSQAWKNRIWNGSILAAFVAAMAVFVFLLQTEKTPGAEALGVLVREAGLEPARP